MPPSDPHPKGLDLVAGILACLLPGAGQFYRGEPYRGVMAAVGVLGLFLGGMLVGGIDVIDSREDKIWFVGQAFVGPVAFGINYVHQTRFKALDPDTRLPRSGHPDEMRVSRDLDADGKTEPVWAPATDGKGPPNVKSVAKMNEIGTLAATLAGMLNFIIILDALLPTSRSKRGRPHPSTHRSGGPLGALLEKEARK
ncbi:MAG: DUF6677 family protein [Phycisphaerales bacterium]